MCPVLFDPSNGHVDVTTLAAGGTATYTCDSGFRLSASGSNPLVCSSEGNWSGSGPTCLSKSLNICIMYSIVIELFSKC